MLEWHLDYAPSGMISDVGANFSVFTYGELVVVMTKYCHLELGEMKYTGLL